MIGHISNLPASRSAIGVSDMKLINSEEPIIPTKMRVRSVRMFRMSHEVMGATNHWLQLFHRISRQVPKFLSLSDDCFIHRLRLIHRLGWSNCGPIDMLFVQFLS